MKHSIFMSYPTPIALAVSLLIANSSIAASGAIAEAASPVENAETVNRVLITGERPSSLPIELPTPLKGSMQKPSQGRLMRLMQKMP